MTIEFTLAGSEELDRRRDALDELLRVAFDPDDRPFIVTDFSSLWDFVVDTEDEVRERCWRHYGVRLGKREFGMKIWLLLDYLASARTRASDSR